MSLTEFAMVEELASLIRDNLPCKYLVLSVEDALVNFLKDDTSSEDILELEPMNSYSRLLIHRYADVFGFSHYSVGEEGDRHLVLERCPETSIPSILVSDLLWKYDELQSPKILEVAKRKEDLPGLDEEIPKFEFSLEERETAYLAARERIFSVDDEYDRGEPVKPRPQHNPIVARRMIAHALGQRIRPSSKEVSQSDAKELQEKDNTLKNREKEEGDASVDTQATLEKNGMTVKYLKSCDKQKETVFSGSSSSNSQTKTLLENVDKTTPKSVSSGKERGETNIQKTNFRQEHMGAAKRMFANALGLHPRNTNTSRSSQSKNVLS